MRAAFLKESTGKCMYVSADCVMLGVSKINSFTSIILIDRIDDCDVKSECLSAKVQIS